MADAELEAIRAARLAQLQAQAQAQGGAPGPNSAADQQQAAKQAAAADQMKRDILATVLDSAARERLSRIALVSPQRSGQVEAILVRMAQSGQLRGKVTEEALIGLLQQAESAQSNAPKKGAITYQRRRGDFSDDDDFDL